MQPERNNSAIELQIARRIRLHKVLHGLEQGFNDNACKRTTVIHKSGMVSENATRRMSSGCPMVSRERINQVHALLGEGALVYTFTPDEASLADGICGKNLLR